MFRELKSFHANAPRWSRARPLKVLALAALTLGTGPATKGQGAAEMAPAVIEDASEPAGPVAAIVASEPIEAGATAEALEPVALTIPELVERVRSQNLELLFQKESVRRALERSYQRRAALLPQLSASASQTRQDSDFVRSDQQAGFGSFGTDPYNSFNARVSATMNVIDANRYADYRLAQFDHAIARMDYEVAEQDVLQQAVQLYFTQLQDLRRVEIIKSNIERDSELLELARDQFEAGVAIKIDVTRAEVRVATERRNLLQAETEVEASEFDLKTLLDIDLDRELLLDLSIIDQLASPPALKRYAAMNNALWERAELDRAKASVDQAELARRAAGWQRLPRVEIFGDWGVDSEVAFDGDEEEAWLIGLRASIPIWEGGRIAAEKREADAAVRQSEYQLRDLRNRIEREFRFAVVDMDSRYEQIEIASEEIRLGREEVAQAEERYREGLADNSELIDAQQRLSDAEDSHLDAVYFYGLSRLAFARAIGRVERVLE